jgi:hypothetical protein
MALCKAGYRAEQRPDWDDVAPSSGCAWLTATTIADDVHAFAARVEAIIEPHDGWIWVCGPHWYNAAYNEDPDEPGKLQ